MIITDLKIALKSLRATKTRTALTMLGIIIGVAAVTIVMALGEGAKQKVSEQAQALGNNLLTIRPGKAVRDGQGNITDYNFLAALGSSTLSERDVQSVQDNKHITATAPIMSITGSISQQGKNQLANTSIIATNEECQEVLNLSVRFGDFINDTTNRETVVLGRNLAIELLGSDTAIGEKINLRGQEFTVIGILDNYPIKPSLTNFYDFNRTAFIPLDAGKGFSQGIAHIQQINARIDKQADPVQIAGQIHQTILGNHGGEEDFTVLRPQEGVAIADNLLRLVTLLTSAVASISLVVGGIGVMNIMLVSVTERTREIGIRKAVGATNTQIMRQFIIEALLMSIVGSLLGVVLAYGLAFMIGGWFDFRPMITPLILATAVGVATGVGIIFGIAPAFKASRKDPIEALRHFS
jgi:ABC-type antimicrobial peptide transport system permease subunit